MGIHEIAVTDIDGNTIQLGDHKGKALLVVNVASQCGLTPQYAGLEQLHETYGARGFEVLGFPCNQFMGQEPGTEAEIKEFCETSFGVQFPLFSKLEVNGEGRHELFEALTTATDDDGYTGDIRWNFEKFLVSPAGEVVARFGPKTAPDAPELIAAIEASLPE